MTKPNDHTPIPDEDMPLPPWERADKETDPAWEAFHTYRDMGTARSIAKVARQLDKSGSLLGRWNSRFRWRERVVSYDHELDRQRRLEANNAVRKMVEQHATMAQSGLQVLQSVPMAFAHKLRTTDQEELIAELATLPLADLVDMMNKASMPIERLTKVERLARGEPTEITHAEELVATVGPEDFHYDDDDDPTALATFLAGLHAAGVFDVAIAASDAVEGDGPDEGEDPS